MARPARSKRPIRSKRPVRSKRRRAILVGIISTIVLLAVTGLVTLMLGKVRGTEFAPSHFTTRSFTFWELPLLKLQVSPIQRDPVVTPVTNHLRSQGLIDVPSDPPSTWHLVEIQRGVGSPTPADAEILTSYLALSRSSGSTSGSSDLVWEEWTRSHAAAAKVFWPVIQRLARRELYILMPEIFEIASEETRPQPLATAIDNHLRQAYVSLATDLRDAGRPDLADSLLRDAAADFPDDRQIDRLRNSLAGQAPPQ